MLGTSRFCRFNDSGAPGATKYSTGAGRKLSLLFSAFVAVFVAWQPRVNAEGSFAEALPVSELACPFLVELVTALEIPQRPSGGFGNQIWSRFDHHYDGQFALLLGQFRRDDNQTGSKNLRGGEGQLFLSDAYPNLALKRFYDWGNRGAVDPWKGVELLKAARALEETDPEVAQYLEIAKIYSQGTDWILRDFDPLTQPLKDVQSEDALWATNHLIQYLEKSDQPVARKILRLLGVGTNRPHPSVNVHWSPRKKRIYIFDMARNERPRDRALSGGYS